MNNATESQADRTSRRNPNRRHSRKTFFKYVTASTAISILTSRKLRWSSPLIFNDPFDVPRELQFDFTRDELRAAVQELFISVVEEGRPIALTNPRLQAMHEFVRTRIPDGRRRQFAAELRDSLAANPVYNVTDKDAFEGFHSLWKEFLPTMRILCMSAVPDSTPMWLHYADRYAGVVLEFECSDELDSVTLMARPVSYQKDHPKLPSLAAWARSIMGLEPIDLKELFSEYQYVKGAHWAYEEEWRIASYGRPGETGLYADYLFDEKELIGIYLGTATSDETVSTLKKLAAEKYKHVRFFRAKLPPGSRSFLFEAS